MPSTKNKRKQYDKTYTIQQKYDISILNRFTTTGNKSKHYKSKTKWAKFTYVGKETKFIIKIFNNTSLKIAFTIGKWLSIKKNPNQEKFDKSVVYQLTCPDSSYCSSTTLYAEFWPSQSIPSIFFYPGQGSSNFALLTSVYLF